MSRLEELIQKLCPDGVEYCQLSTLADISTGSHNTNEELDDGAYPFFVRSQDVRRLNTYDYDETAIITSGDGVGVGKIFHYISGKYALHQRAYRIHIIDDRIMSEFFFHYMKATFFEYIQKTAVNSSVTSVRRPMLNKYPVPVPPLEVQREIVRILDNFTSLTAELQAELQARKKQYEYYRDELLKPQEKIPMVTLGEIGRVRMCKRILKEQTNSIGDVPFYKIGTFGKKADAFITQELFEEYKKKYSYPEKGDILISCSGTIGRTIIFDGKPSYFQDSNIVWLEHDETKVLNKYLMYCYSKQPWKISTGGTISRLYNDNILKAKIPAPSLNVQKRLVEVLDNFEKICSDLNIGLPAEIEARQKQYEYYRDALLSFDNSYFVNVERERERERERDEWHSGLIKLWQYVFGYAPVKLKDIAISIKDGMHNLPKSLFDNGDYPILSAQNIHNGFIDFSTKRYVDINTFLKERRRTNIESGDVLLTIVATIGRTAIIKDNTDFLLQRSVCVIKPKRCVLPSYLKYYLDTSKTQAYMQSNAHGSAQAGLYLNQVAEIEIMLPTLKEQERIVSILDRFDSLCNDISSGLPAEIEARQKQYEYYRDKLLSF